MKTKDIEVGQEYLIGRWHRARVLGFRERPRFGQDTVNVLYVRDDGTETAHSAWVRPQDVKMTWAENEAAKAERKAAAEVQRARVAELAAKVDAEVAELNRILGKDVFYRRGGFSWQDPSLGIHDDGVDVLAAMVRNLTERTAEG